MGRTAANEISDSGAIGWKCGLTGVAGGIAAPSGGRGSTAVPGRAADEAGGAAVRATLRAAPRAASPDSTQPVATSIVTPNAAIDVRVVTPRPIGPPPMRLSIVARGARPPIVRAADCDHHADQASATALHSRDTRAGTTPSESPSRFEDRSGSSIEWEDRSVERAVKIAPPWRVRCPACAWMVRLTPDASRRSAYRCPHCEARLHRVSPGRVVAVLVGAA
jgi:hypothetical protein